MNTFKGESSHNRNGLEQQANEALSLLHTSYGETETKKKSITVHQSMAKMWWKS